MCIDGKCTCKNGYARDKTNGTCVQSLCQQPCVNGTCIEPNQCECDKGYQLDSVKQHLCNPICTEPCKQANCVSPEKCECFPGIVFFEH